jgi:hypothetical protein
MFTLPTILAPVALPSTYIPIGLLIENVVLDVSILFIARSKRMVSVES